MELTKKMLLREMELLQTPIDFEEMQLKGLLIKKGSKWLAPNLHNLPEHVAKKIKAHAPSAGGVLLTFSPPRKLRAK